MCLIYLAHRVDPFYRLVVAANRDEYHLRPSAPAAWWQDGSGILAGRDLQAGGTWMGITRGGRFAAITNYRDPTRQRADAASRGHLVSGFLGGGEPALDYLARIAGEGERYNGFSLLVHDGATLAFYSNRGGAPETVAPGVHGLSNHQLDEPWPKVEEGKLDLLGMLARGAATPAGLLGLLDRREPAVPGALSARFILGSQYGTRCSSIILVDADGEVLFRERSFDAAGEAHGDEVHSFRIERH
jgi:uncharacterized protein with NRDE domain